MCNTQIVVFFVASMNYCTRLWLLGYLVIVTHIATAKV